MVAPPSRTARLQVPSCMQCGSMLSPTHIASTLIRDHHHSCNGRCRVALSPDSSPIPQAKTRHIGASVASQPWLGLHTPTRCPIKHPIIQHTQAIIVFYIADSSTRFVLCTAGCLLFKPKDKDAKDDCGMYRVKTCNQAD